MPAGETKFVVFTNSTSVGELGVVPLRERAARLLAQIARLAPAVDLPDEHCVLAERLSSSVSEPFLVVVVGEVNSGKSTLVNALLGGMFAPSGLLPVTERVCVFQFGETPDSMMENGVTTITRPLDVLKQVTIVDTPGVNSIESNHEQITDQFLPRADLALFVFNATNPWGAAGWEFLRRMSDVWLKDAVIVLSHSDLVAPEDLKCIMERLEEETSARFGAALPMFPVCASEAVGVRRMDGVIADVAMWRATGMERFDRFLQQAVGGNVALLKLLNTVVAARRLIAEIGVRADPAHNVLAGTRDLLQLIDSELEMSRDAALNSIPILADDIVGGVATEEVPLTSALDERLSIWSSILSTLKGGERGEETEMLLIRRVGRVAEEIGNQAGGRLVAALDFLWDELRRQIEINYGFALRTASPVGHPDWDKWSGRMSIDLVACARSELQKIGIANLLDRRLRRRSIFMRVLAGGALIAGAVSIIAWRGAGMVSEPAMDVAGAALIFCAVFSLCWVVYAMVSGQALVNHFAKTIEDAREPLRDALRNQLAESVVTGYKRFAEAFQPLRRLHDKDQKNYSVVVREFSRLEDECRQLEDDIEVWEKSVAHGKLFG